MLQIETLVSHAFLSRMGYGVNFEKNSHRFSVSPNPYSSKPFKPIIRGEIKYQKGIPKFILIYIEVNNDRIKQGIELMFFDHLAKISGMGYLITSATEN